MTRTSKRKKPDESSSDEKPPKNRRPPYAQARANPSIPKLQKPKKAVRFATDVQPAVAKSPSPPVELPIRDSYPYFDPDEVKELEEIAAMALKETKEIEKEKLREDLADTKKELELTKYNLELCREFEKGYDYEKQKAASALKEALNELAVVRAEKAELEKLLREKIEKETAEAGDEPTT